MTRKKISRSYTVPSLPESNFVREVFSPDQSRINVKVFYFLEWAANNVFFIQFFAHFSLELKIYFDTYKKEQLLWHL